jgi:alkylhydroperoxidase family enzyme
MPRIPYPDPESLTPLQRSTSEGSLNIGRMMAHMPDKLLAAFGDFGRAVLQNEELNEHLRELVIVRVGYLSNSAYELHQHIQLARKIGIPEAKLEGLKFGPDASCFDVKERAMLRLVDELVRNVCPCDATLADVREQMSVAEIFSVIAAVGVYMMICRLLETTGVELDEEGVVIDPGS